MKFQRMRDIREDNDLTQLEVAKIMKVARSTYKEWETGSNTIPLIKLNAFCEYFKVSLDYITGLSNTKTYNTINKDINVQLVASRLRELGLKENLKQKDIFSFLNINSSTYSAYETGKVLIPTIFIYSIAKKYNYSIDWLLGKIK